MTNNKLRTINMYIYIYWLCLRVTCALSNPRTKVLLKFDTRVYRNVSSENLFDTFLFSFSTNELKFQQNFSDHLSSVNPSVCLSVRLSVNFTFSFSQPLGQFQPNLAQRSLDDRDWIFFQMKHHALFDGEITKMHRQIEKSFSPEALCQFNQTWHKNSLDEGNLYCSNDGPRFFPRGHNRQTAKIHWWNLKIFFSRTNKLMSTKHGTKYS